MRILALSTIQIVIYDMVFVFILVINNFHNIMNNKAIVFIFSSFWFFIKLQKIWNV
jgi:hypothetical protein